MQCSQLFSLHLIKLQQLIKYRNKKQYIDKYLLQFFDLQTKDVHEKEESSINVQIKKEACETF